MNDASLLLKVKDFYELHDLDIPNHLEQDLQGLVNHAAPAFENVIDSLIESYKNHIDRDLKLGENELTHLQFLAIIALKIARDKESQSAEVKQTQTHRAAKILSVYSGGENFFSQACRVSIVCPPEDEHWPYSVPRLISFAEALIGSRTARFQREREERELIEIAREEAPPYTAAPCINFSAIDPTAIYTRLQADLMQPEYCTTSVTPHWNIRIYSDPTNLNACVLKYTHLAGGVELVMVRNQTNVQLTVKINPKIQSKMGYVLIYLLRGEIASDLNRSSTADIWTCDFVSLTSKGMSKELLIHSLTILNKYFKKVPNNSLPIEDLSQRIPDTHTHLPFVSMALAPQMEQEFNNNNNRNNFRA